MKVLLLLFQLITFPLIGAFLGVDWRALVPKHILQKDSDTRERTSRLFKIASTVLPKPPQSPSSSSFESTEEMTHSTHSTSHSDKAMPWHSSIAPYTPHKKDTLLFMPYYEAHLSIMKDRLTNLRQITLPPTHHYAENFPSSKLATRVSNVEFTSDEYRKIRLTYYDAGDSIQVFNSLWYPNPNLGNVPLLGVDLLAFGRKKYLVAVEYQPVAKYGLGEVSKTRYERQEELEPFDFGHGRKWQSIVEPIYNNLPSELRGCKSDRFFEGTDFFSDVMLFGRLERQEEDLIYEGGDLWNAFHSYTESHIDIVQRQINHLDSLGLSSHGVDQGDSSQDMLNHVETLVLQGQKDHDVYMASRDPAHALFSKKFGTEWADSFLYDFLFDLANGEEEETKQ